MYKISGKNVVYWRRKFYFNFQFFTAAAFFRYTHGWLAVKPIICYIKTRIKCGQIIRLERGNNALSTDMKTEDDIYPQVTKIIW